MSASPTARPPLTLITAPPGWLGGGSYTTQLITAVRTRGGPDDSVLEVGPWRGEGHDLRLPMSVLRRIGPAPSRLIGRSLWRDRCVHRVSVDLPPARHEVVSVLDLAAHHHDDETPLPRSLREQVARARGLVTLSATIAEELRADLGAERVWIVPPAVDDRFFTAAASAADELAPFVLHVGGATSRKGLDRLAEAWPAVVDAAPGLALRLVGPPHPTGRDAVLDLPGATWHGLLPDADVLRLMRSASAVVVPSTYEGFGMPVAEALALGTPVVVMAGTAPTEVGGDIAFVADATGGPDSLAEAISDAVEARWRDPARLARGRERARRWSVAEVGDAQMRVYDEAFA